MVAWRVLVLAAILVALNGCNRGPQPTDRGALDQGWDYPTRMEWWYTSQGSWIIPYDWFLALEQADSDELFRSDTNLERLRFITHPADPKWNPDGLPIGFVADYDVNTGDSHFGVTCAACHTGRLKFGNKQLIVEGAPAHADFSRFLIEMVQALQLTLDDDDKFARFGHSVLGSRETSTSLALLHEQLEKRTAELAHRVDVNLPTHPYGHARLDAFGNILNESSVFSINEPTNAKPSNTPVSYPVLWDTPHHDIVQWNGTAVNAGIGPYTRNVGEVVGVFGDLRISEVEVGGSKKLRFQHHVKIHNLERLETILTTLHSPKWPADILPAIDRKKARRGQKIYNAHCVGCHESIDRADPNRRIAAKLVPASEVGTDQLLAEHTGSRKSKTGILKGHPMLPVTKYIPNLGLVDAFGSEASSARVLAHGIIGILRNDLSSVKLVRGLPEYIHASKKNAYYDDCDPDVDGDKCLRPPRYKARPLNGIWSSAPFLHNGSVPSLRELLKKPSQRVKVFHVGSWKFDAVKVGFATDPLPATSEFDTSIPGNSNQGHDYGTHLSEDEKLDLIEYIKSL